MHKVKDSCPGCGACEGICPVGAIVPGDSLGVAITDQCVDCGICVNACPVQLIEPAPAAVSRPRAAKNTPAAESGKDGVTDA